MNFLLKTNVYSKPRGKLVEDAAEAADGLRVYRSEPAISLKINNNFFKLIHTYFIILYFITLILDNNLNLNEKIGLK